MTTLWVYGCSFSEPFGIMPGGADFHNDGSRNFHDYDFWGTHLARRLGVECKTKSLSGIGWNYINDRIDEDILKWHKDDYIVINPSFFARVTIEELVQRDSQTELAHKMQSWNYIFNHNEGRWRRKIATLQHFGFHRVYTWIVDHTPNVNEVKNLITVDGYQNWKDWLDQHKEYWIDPDFNPPHGDWHFNPAGHRAAADKMYEFITR
jgi:hypothetical protein